MDPAGSHSVRSRASTRSVAFVVARLTSSRLPSKQFRGIGDRPLIDWTIDELRRCRRLDQIVLATADEPENEPLREYCRKQGLECFWFSGDVNHVTTRLRRAAERYQADIGVLVSGDCPLLQAEAIDDLVSALEACPDADFVQIAGRVETPALQGVVISRVSAWQLADDLADRPELKEHQFPLLGRRPDLFQALREELGEELCLPYHRLSVDTVADLEFLNAVWRRLRDAGRPFNLREAVRLLKGSPELGRINAHVHQRRVEERPRAVLYFADAGGAYGYGHLTRSVELAGQIVERRGWPVHFVVDHQDAVDRLRETGFTSSWGAFGRPHRQGGSVDPRLRERIESADLVVVDIFDQRGPEAGWRKKYGIDGRAVVVENWLDWSREADLVVGPNVLGRGRTRFRPGLPKVIEGSAYLIIRREVQRLAALSPSRETDLLAYVHADPLRQDLRKWAARSGLRSEVPEEFTQGFLDRLSRTRVFLSGFGISFYEALALGVVPVCWPDSDAHREDAKGFYRWWGVSPLIVESVADLDRVFSAAREIAVETLPKIEDGTPAIVEELGRLFESP
ncbi:MAG: NTP transferase domain-containing protein [Acidobacteriota bacterium]